MLTNEKRKYFFEEACSRPTQCLFDTNLLLMVNFRDYSTQNMVSSEETHMGRISMLLFKKTTFVQINSTRSF
jgi:hypothetical protein